MRIQSTSQTFSIDERSGDFNGRQHIDVAQFQVRQGDATCGIIINGLRTKLHILPTITTDQTKSGLIWKDNVTPVPQYPITVCKSEVQTIGTVTSGKS